MDVCCNDIDKLIEVSKDLVILDVRSKEEFKENHLSQAINIPVDELKDRYLELSVDKAVLVYCSLGYRSIRAANILVEKGFSVYNMKDGYDLYLKNEGSTQ
ncbi:hypothetical protein EZV73_05275 [Acidaminobacter sp. JC074]|uniref:rhodanese-like domain-containing protein n=1 Tax=Acidaminobacter sp. JC074 TaxID=2530199 RepID=UPI001F0EF1B4|nr:rhodanese-like domain-containing protein [Acidaminobacter sp. JC074]MCH4886967.1 hypothetical protein [Acidaminobacter sp. JC074]